MKPKLKLVSNNTKPAVIPYDISMIPNGCNKSFNPVFVPEQGLYLIKDGKGNIITRLVYAPTTEVLNDVKTLSKTELREKYPKTYSSHRNMKSRVANSISKATYDRKYLNPTISDFTNFLLLMSPNPNDTGDPIKYSIDRINPVDPLYSPDRCRWLDNQGQSDNKEVVTHLTHNGKTLTLKGWSNETGIPYQTILKRVKDGKLPHEALAWPPSIAKAFWREVFIYCNPEAMEKLYKKTKNLTETRLEWLAVFILSTLRVHEAQIFRNYNKYPDTIPKTITGKIPALAYLQWVFNNINHHNLVTMGVPLYYYPVTDVGSIKPNIYPYQYRAMSIVEHFLNVVFYARIIGVKDVSS